MIPHSGFFTFGFLKRRPVMLFLGITELLSAATAYSPMFEYHFPLVVDMMLITYITQRRKLKTLLLLRKRRISLFVQNDDVNADFIFSIQLLSNKLAVFFTHLTSTVT